MNRLRKQGDELLLKIDPAVLKAAGLDENTPLLVTADGHGLRVLPAEDATAADVDDATFNSIVEDMHQKWGSVFKKLAE